MLFFIFWSFGWQVACRNKDVQLADFVESEYLTEQVNFKILRSAAQIQHISYDFHS